jgi:Cys-tRNA(Pro)/Cys-tRNA(Cys) deacylase
MRRLEEVRLGRGVGAGHGPKASGRYHPAMPDESTVPSTPAIDAIAAAAVPHRVVRTERASSAEEAARLQGIEARQLLRTIVVRRGDDDFLFVLVPAGRRFDWPKLRELLGVRRMSLPDGAEARAVTGYERYTITPFGSTRAWPVISDAAIVAEPVVSIGGGAFGLSIHLDPTDLVRALGAEVADVSVPDAKPG